ncbi:probable bifunctional dTTP/UTP pyrophosphatase/methyltransferase protein [Galendromus occidentalis]|uniref:Probable bifunctional dTTP/UTP pyrophosphatase/methyltransferase protein n=1 Tax=Galendromus occidentalis TaxID=34638 RepID=A0AAJ6VZX8_9ACAR|nr:probable bifunctional dTTP/UTP pyrophosphatase/methyltransferase protein [Galendromus occidentalis]
MIGPYLERLNRLRIILASASARRKEILEQIGLKFDVVPSAFEENLDKSSFKEPQDYALRNSELKAKQVAESVDAFDLIIACDTIVTCRGSIYEKPKDPSVAIQMLKDLSGSTSEVHSGLTFVTVDSNGSRNFTSFTESTTVEFCELSEEVITTYVRTGEPLDKAGAYGIQGHAACLVKSINGDFYNVVGFPLNHFCRQLSDVIQQGKMKL